MDRTETEKFILCVKNYPLLYNTEHKKYKSVVEKAKVWEQVAKEMNETSEILRTKWKGLKDGYIKYKKWQLHRNGAVKSYSNWCWGSRLEFLDPFINIRKRKYEDRTANQESSFMNMYHSQDDCTRDNLEQYSCDTENVLETEEILDDEIHIKMEPPTSVISNPSISRSQSPTLLRDPIATEEIDKSKLLSFMQNKRSKGIDSVDLLFMSYADTFKKFSVLTQAELKVKLATMFADAELQEYKSSNNVPNNLLS